MRFFKNIGKNAYSYYESGKLFQIKSGGVVSAVTIQDQEKFAGMKNFIECDKNGRVSVNSVPGSHPHEKITSRAVYRYNTALATDSNPNGKLEKIT